MNALALRIQPGKTYADGRGRKVEIVAEVSGSYGMVGIVTDDDGDRSVRQYDDDGECLISSFGFAHLEREVEP